MPDPSLSHLILPALILAATGAFAGVLAGLFGVGGGIILVPCYVWVFEQMGRAGPDLMQVCLATSLATIIVTSIRSVLAHNRRGAVDWQVLRGWAPGIAVGALAGALTVSALRTQTLQVIFGVLVLVVATYMAVSRPSWRLAEDMPSGARRAGLSAFTGFFSVLLGIGGGSIGVPLMSLHGRPIHQAVATAAGFGALIAIPSVALFLLTRAEAAPPLTLGSVNLPAFLLTISMTVLTAPLGASLAHRTDAVRLKRYFAVFLMLVGLNMLRKALL